MPLTTCNHTTLDIWQTPNRCLVCGHRTFSAEAGLRPVATRLFPMWWWPFELMGRAQARAAKYLPAHLRASVRHDAHP